LKEFDSAIFSFSSIFKSTTGLEYGKVLRKGAKTVEAALHSGYSQHFLKAPAYLVMACWKDD
jgi:hypothetical protein